MAGFRHNVYVVSKIGNWGARTGQAVPKTTVPMRPSAIRQVASSGEALAAEALAGAMAADAPPDPEAIEAARHDRFRPDA